MLENIPKANVLFLDIETVPAAASYNDLDLRFQNLWSRKTEWQRKEDETAEEFYKRAGIYAEFGKIVCISVGYFNPNEAGFRIKSFAGHDEKALLLSFAQLLSNHFNAKEHTLCAHNGKEFDFPFIARRMLINEI